MKNANVQGKGLILGAPGSDTAGTAVIAIELGLDTLQLPPSLSYPSDLIETQFIVELDSRLGELATGDGASQAPSFIDDDGVASYFINSTNGMVGPPLDDRTTEVNNNQPNPTVHRIRGPRDKLVTFTIVPNSQLTNSNFLFDRLGGTFSTTTVETSLFNSGHTFRFIDSFVRVTAATVGVSIDVPIRFIKKV